MSLRVYFTDGSKLEFPALSAVRPFPGDDAFVQGLDNGQTPYLLVPVDKVHAVEIY